MKKFVAVIMAMMMVLALNLAVVAEDPTEIEGLDAADFELTGTLQVTSKTIEPVYYVDVSTSFTPGAFQATVEWDPDALAYKSAVISKTAEFVFEVEVVNRSDEKVAVSFRYATESDLTITASLHNSKTNTTTTDLINAQELESAKTKMDALKATKPAATSDDKEDALDSVKCDGTLNLPDNFFTTFFPDFSFNEDTTDTIADFNFGKVTITIAEVTGE